MTAPIQNTCNHVTSSYTSNCVMCGASPLQMLAEYQLQVLREINERLARLEKKS